MNLFSIIRDYIRNMTFSLKEAYTFKDKLILLRYLLKSPLYLYTYLGDKRHNYKLPRDITLKNKYGIFFCGNDIWAVYSLLSIYELELIPYFKIETGDVLDVGANLGRYAVLCGSTLRNSGKVVCIEPDSYNFSILEKNIKLNNLKNVVALNIGCYSKKGTLNLNMADFGVGGHSLVKDFGRGSVKIKVDKIDNIVDSLKLKNLKILKVDVEGAELDVLKGASNTLSKLHPKVIFEAWDNEKLNQIEIFLKDYKYNKIKQVGFKDYVAT